MGLSIKKAALSALKILHTNGPTRKQDLLKLDSQIKKNTINNLRIGGYVQMVGTATKGQHDVQWALTIKGRLAVETGDTPSQSKKKNTKAVIDKTHVAAPRIPIETGPLTLSPNTCTRAGALDAFSKPSLVMGSRIFNHTR